MEDILRKKPKEDRAFMKAMKEKRRPRKTLMADQRLTENDFIDLNNDEIRERYFTKLENDVYEFDINYIDYIAASKHWRDAQENLPSKINSVNSMYANYMFTMAMRPLLNKSSSEQTAKAIGTFIGFYITNPDFRSLVKDTFMDHVQPFIERRAMQAGPNSMWADMAEQNRQYMNGGRPTYSPRRAALVQYGITKSVYDDLRDPDKDPEEVMEEYNEAIANLYEHAAVDGITPDQINENLRIVVGELKESHPEMLSIFAEFEQGVTDEIKWEQSSFVDKKGRHQNVEYFYGDFMNEDGSTYRGTFTPREPKSMREHQSDIADILDKHMENLTPEEFSEFVEVCGTAKRTVLDGENIDHNFQDNKAFKELSMAFVKLGSDSKDHISNVMMCEDICMVKFREYLNEHPDIMMHKAAEPEPEYDANNNGVDDRYEDVVDVEFTTVDDEYEL